MTWGVRRPAAFLLLLAVAATALAAPPQVEIRAQAQLLLDRVRLVASDLAELRGQLVDHLTGDGIAGQSIVVRVGDATTTALTEPDGRFRATVTVAPGAQAVELNFRGSPLIDATRLDQITDPARAPVTLSMDVEDAPGGARIVVRAEVDDQPVQLTVALATGPAIGELAPATTVSTGTPYVVTRAAVGGVGARRVRATFGGDDLRQPASVEKTLALTATTTATIALTATRIAYEDGLGISGKVSDEDGRPVGRAAVTLASGDRRLAQGATGQDGSYRFTVEGEILGQGQWGLQVQADPDQPALQPSRSRIEIVRVAAPQPVPVSYTVAAFLATAFAAGGFFMARARPWQRLGRPAPPADVATGATADDQPLAGGLVAARPGLVSTLRRASDDGFSGVVRDTVRGRPVVEAVVRLRIGPEPSPSRTRGGGTSDAAAPADRHAITGREGTFAIEALAPGEWLTEVAAPGHVTESFAVSIPHRGELRGVRVDLVPVRERVFQLYRRAAEPILPQPRLWGVWSPRQIVDHVRSKRPTPALAELTSFVEELYFSARVADEAVLPEASARVDRAIQERARAAS
jgi:hypothetical protein